VESSSESSDLEDEEEQEEEDEEPEEQEEIETGEPTSRLAIMNCDWEILKAVDMLVLLQGFMQPEGAIKSVAVYPSELGIKKLSQEETNGPEEIWNEDYQEEKGSSKKAKAFTFKEKESAGLDFDPVKLRNYELQKLKYFYCIVECDSVQSAKSLYEQCDGLEFEKSSNVIDIRYVPEGLSLPRKPREVATDIPTNYKPPVFYTKALQHSKVECTWDATSLKRMELTKKKFTKEEVEDMDYKMYLASSDSDSSGDEVPADEAIKIEFDESLGVVDEKKSKTKEKLKNQLKGLLESIKPDDKEEEEMEITFTPGLTEKAESILERKKEAEKTKDETIWETKLRIKRERKKERKKQLKEQDTEEKEVPSEEDEKKKSKKKGKKKKKLTKEESRQQAELELVAMPDGEKDNKKGYNLETLKKEAKMSKRATKKKLIQSKKKSNKQ